MMLRKKRKGRDFVRHARKRGATIRNGKGSHMVISTDRGTCVVPVHNKDLGKGLRCKIAKTFLAIGLAILILVWLI